MPESLKNQKLKHNNSDYTKTFYYLSMVENEIIVASFEYPDSLIDYLENLIFDVINKRELTDSQIVLVVHDAWLQQALSEILKGRGLIESTNRSILWFEICERIIGSTNDLLILNFSKYNEESCHGVFLDARSGRNEVFIFLEFSKLISDYQSNIEEFRSQFRNSIWLGIDTVSSNERISYFSNGDQIIEYLPVTPESYEGFVNNSVLQGIKTILNAFDSNEDAAYFYNQLNGDIFSNEKENLTIEICTDEFFDGDHSTEEQMEELYETVKEFKVYIEINKFGLKLEIELQDFEIGGTTFVDYEMDFESEISEKGNLNNLNEIIDEICERINNYKVNVTLK